jgi:predicted RNase H-like HicB family nuclease
MEYIAYLHKDGKSDYGVSFPDFPGCITAGSTLDEARRMAAQALSFHIAGMREDGESIPEPSTLDDLRNDPAMKGAVAFLVAVAEPEKTVRFNITARESQLAEIDSRARAARLTRSAFLVHSALGRKGSKVAEPTSVTGKARQRRKSA